MLVKDSKKGGIDISKGINKTEKTGGPQVQKKSDKQKNQTQPNEVPNKFTMGSMMNDNGVNGNFHNFFTNDRIFGSPGNQFLPPSLQGVSKIKVENHYNQHTTINNYNFMIQNSPKVLQQPDSSNNG